MSCVHLGRTSPTQLERLLGEARASALSYDHVCSTLSDGSPPGIADRTFRRTTSGTLDGAVGALRHWAAHRGIRARSHPADAPLTVGTTLLVVAPFGPVQLVVPNRIVAVIDDPDRCGFAYGTLPGHAEAGEELFLAEQRAGCIELTIRVHARPATALAHLGTPIVHLLQAAAARRYLDAWADAIVIWSTR
jgi:uncharacterized protein (UPF0548 family)